MARVLSALVLLPIVIATIWWLPPWATLALAEIVVVLAFAEYAGLVARLGARLPVAVTGSGVVVSCAALAWEGSEGSEAHVVLMAATIVVGSITVGMGRRGAEALQDVSAALFALLYLGLPLGALVAIRMEGGREVLLLLLACVMTSDTAQYYGGRAFGRRSLAPAISPKKTVEGAVAGLVAGTLAMVVIGEWWLPAVEPAGRALLGATVVGLGLVGDLFESGLKRSAGVKDTSGVIPGHGGVLDRVDSLLFATPFYYMVVRYGA